MAATSKGIRAASLAYFGKEPRRLTPAEAALLVALPQSPEARRPDRNAAAAHAARDRVLDRVAERRRSIRRGRDGGADRSAMPDRAPRLPDARRARRRARGRRCAAEAGRTA